MAFATVNDVEIRYGRALTPAQRAQVEAWISDLEVLIRQRIPNLDVLMAAGRPSPATLQFVVCEAVIRKLNNPDGLRSRTSTIAIDDYSETEIATIDASNAAGWLGLTDDEWNLLLPGTSGEAFTIRPYGAP